MARKLLAALPLALTAMMAVGAPAMADVRNFPYSYPYNTQEAGEREIELYTNLNSAGKLSNQLELGFGVTDHLTMSLYGVFSNLHNDTRAFDALKLEGRYRIAEQNELPVDMGVYLEYEHPIQADAGEVEGKLLLEKTLGNFVVDSNLIAAKELADEPVSFGATLGGAYALNDALKLGIETRYNSIGAGDKFYAGPTAALNLGGTRLVAGVYYGGSQETQGRLIIGQEF
ncbi:MAG TPA: hypothetical protein V6D05_11520 [Stenomitos sp.]